MSKYSHFEMCEKIFGQKYKWNEQKHDYEPYSRTDMWNKMIEQQDKISDLEAKLADSEEEHELLIDQFEEETEKLRKQIKQESDARKRFVEEVKNLKQQLAISEKALELACETLQDINFKLYNTEMNFVDFFKQQAKEMLENE